ncbi:hypothetical protein [Mycolicibacterium hodleri]|uniref:Uncharacterized protein n=1 Tax=Mycolicibacterium hodleri TaxID=49897 RepID=A0A502EHG1_9MYCO|nr:hypothetical protein [Mycolicibacterium hodleri]TPG35930.1 hypothetical protein EAH80_07870 [Mycolicibacterium hodleri]
MATEETPDTLTIEIEQTDRGWMVVHVVDGDRKSIEPPHPDRESAEAAAAVHTAASDRWTGAAEVKPPEDRPAGTA